MLKFTSTTTMRERSCLHHSLASSQTSHFIWSGKRLNRETVVHLPKRLSNSALRSIIHEYDFVRCNSYPEHESWNTKSRLKTKVYLRIPHLLNLLLSPTPPNEPSKMQLYNQPMSPTSRHLISLITHLRRILLLTALPFVYLNFTSHNCFTGIGWVRR